MNEFVARKGIVSLGGITLPEIYVTSTYTVTQDDYLINASGTFNVTLPSAVGIQGKLYTIKNSDVGIITIITTSGQTIDGALYADIVANNSLQIASDGSNWLVITSSVSNTIRTPINDTNYTVSGATSQTLAYINITARRIVILPAATTEGQVITVVDESGLVSSINRIFVESLGTDVIDGRSYNIQISSYNRVEYVSNGLGGWFINHRNQRLATGCILKPSYSDNHDGSISIGNDGLYNLYRHADGSGLIRTFEISGDTFTLVDGSTNYVVADYNSGSEFIRVTTNVNEITETTVIPLYTIYRGGTRLHLIDWDSLGLALVNKIHQSIVKTQRYRLQSGLELGEIPTRIITLTEGIVWVGANNFTLPEFSSSGNSLFFAHHSDTSWVIETGHTQYNNLQYDNGINLQNLNPNKYAVNYIYRGIEVEDECYMVLGQGNYTLIEAQASLPPPNLPPLITSHAMLVGRIIVEKGTNTAYQIDSIFSAAFALSSSVTHSDLSNLNWLLSNHDGTANKIAGFNASGDTTYYPSNSTLTQNDFLIWSGGTWVSAAGIIGMPSDGTYTDGFFDTWTGSTTIANAVDDINEVLKKLAPSKPPELSTKTILLSSSYASATLNKASDGTAVSYLLVSDLNTTDVQLTDMTTTSTGGGFNKSVGSNLTGVIDGVSVGAITYTDGNIHTGTTNSSKLTSIEYDYWIGVAGKSDFWPAIVARVNDVFSGLSYGVHTSKISWYVGASELQTTNLLTIYYDNPVTPSGNTLNLSAQTYVTRWISGVPTFSTSDLLAVNYGFTGLVSQVYRPNPISASSSYASTVTNTLSGVQTSGTTITGVLNPVVQTAKYIEDITVTVVATNGKGTATTYSNMTIASSQAGKTMRVDTVSNESARKLSGGIAGNFPVTYGGTYSSGSTLLSGSYLYELQMLNGVYRRITGNYTNNFPIAGPNYSSDSNTDYRWVMFSYSITTKSSVNVTVNGANFSTNAGSQVTSNLKIFTKLEGSTGWLDSNNPYPGVGTPINDGDYAMATANSTSTTTTLVKYVTFGAGNYTGTLYVRLGIASGSTITISTITVA